jgi:peptidoglycan/xylan/chitin deacetylase (PgdA/CDA1 family)
MLTLRHCWQKIRRCLQQMRYQPIRVFFFHQVSDVFEPETMWECDWTQTEQFKRNILALRKKYIFVSLQEAHRRLSTDKFRIKRYAALTSDDGWASLKNIIPWLAEQEIPITLFLNPYYMDGIHCQLRPTEKLLTVDEVKDMVERYAPFVTIASHGWTHADSMKMGRQEFEENVIKSEAFLKDMPRKVPFYAFAYGRRIQYQSEWLLEHSLIPVYANGWKNYNNSNCIHRELLDGKVMAIE